LVLAAVEVLGENQQVLTAVILLVEVVVEHTNVCLLLLPNLVQL
jgi:hypothetical protein